MGDIRADAARLVIVRVLVEFCVERNLGICDTLSVEEDKALRARLRGAYPWGERKQHPYRIWRREIRNILGAAR